MGLAPRQRPLLPSIGKASERKPKMDQATPEQPRAAKSGGLAALVTVARHHGLSVTLAELAAGVTAPRDALEADDLAKAASSIGLRTRLVVNPSLRRLRGVPVPAIVRLQGGTWGVFGAEAEPGLFRLMDPVSGKREALPLTEIHARLDKQLIILAKRPDVKTAAGEFGLGFFANALKRYKRPITHVLVASAFVQIFALATPLGFQLIFDKVVV